MILVRTRALPLITSLALVVGIACSNDDEPLPTGTTGAAGKASGGTSAGGTSAGTGGTNAGGASAGTGGTNAGGASAGTGGTNAGGTSAGTGGTSAGTGGTSAGTGGTNAGMGGTNAGMGGTSAGGASAGTGGTNAGGAGGAGTGGTNAGGASAGAGGSTLSCVQPAEPPRSCTTGDECAVVRGASQCNANYVGLQKGSAASYESAAALYRSCAPPPPCAANLPDRADDGSVPLVEGAQPTVRCDVGQCRSSYIQDCTQAPSFAAACTQASDCVAVDKPDCCSTRVTGIAAADAQLATSTFAAFVDSCRACEVVDCAGIGRVADDDSTPPVGMPEAPAKLLCEAGQCRTTFKLAWRRPFRSAALRSAGGFALRVWLDWLGEGSAGRAGAAPATPSLDFSGLERGLAGLAR